MEKDVKESYGVMPDFASLAPEVAAEVNLVKIRYRGPLLQVGLTRGYCCRRSSTKSCTGMGIIHLLGPLESTTGEASHVKRIGV